MVPIPVQQRTSDHEYSSHQEGQVESLSGNGIVNGSSSTAVHHHAPTSVSFSTIGSSGTQGFETQASPETFSSSQHAGPLLPVLDPAQLQVILPMSS